MASTFENGNLAVKEGSTARSYVRWYFFGAMLLLLVVIPLLAPARASRPLFGESGQMICRLLLSTIPFLAVFYLTRCFTKTRRELIVITSLCLMGAGLGELEHFWGTDKAHAFHPSQYANNTAWQADMHREIMRLNPSVLPHSYRFLPDSVVTVFVRLSGDFVFSRILYRFTANVLILSLLYGYARHFLTRFGSALAVLLVVTFYPATVLTYAGQFVDPASHLSFMLCLYCLVSATEAGMIPTLVLGVLAKESVAVMAVCRCFYGTNRRKAFLLAGLYLATGLITAVIVRLVVNGGTFGYQNISGVELKHIIENVAGYDWVLLYFFILGGAGIGTWLGRRYLDWSFKLTAILLLISLFVSSLFFSWLAEVRNMVPALYPLVVGAVKYLENEFGFKRLEGEEGNS